MKNTEREKLRTDRPSGRQAAEQPEHSGSNPATSSLHQGQGPDFQTQDPNAQNENPGMKELKRTPGNRKQAQKPGNPPETVHDDARRKGKNKNGDGA